MSLIKSPGSIIKDFNRGGGTNALTKRKTRFLPKGPMPFNKKGIAFYKKGSQKNPALDSSGRAMPYQGGHWLQGPLGPSFLGANMV